MLGLDARAARAAWTVLLIALVVFLLYLISGTLLIFIAALLLAYLLAPLVNLVDRLAARRFPRTLSLAAVYLLLVAVVTTGAILFGSRIAEQAVSLGSRLPEYLKGLQWSGELPLPNVLQPWKAEIQAAVNSQLEAGAREVVPMVRKIGLQVFSALGNAGYVVLVPVLSFFFLKDARAIRQALLDQLTEGPRRTLVEDILSDVSLLLANYIRAVVLLALSSFTACGAFLGMIGAPYAILLALVAGLLEIVPVLGPLTACITIVLVAGFSGYGHLVWIIGFLVVFRMFQDYLLQPYLMSSGVALHPLLVIFGVLAGAQVAGVAGMFLSIPVLATLRVAWVRMLKWHRALPAAGTAA